MIVLMFSFICLVFCCRVFYKIDKKEKEFYKMLLDLDKKCEEKIGE